MNVHKLTQELGQKTGRFNVRKLRLRNRDSVTLA
jgi:hypothetical protein